MELEATNAAIQLTLILISSQQGLDTQTILQKQKYLSGKLKEQMTWHTIIIVEQFSWFKIFIL
ncbi:MAG: hypothetical protein V9E90_14040 [Saprospiraceae bacterium]